MRSRPALFKFAFISFLGVAWLLSVMQSASASLIDWAKHEEWRRKQLEAVLEEVKLNGKAKYVVLSFRNYDSDGDGYIDAAESKAVQTELQQAADLAAKNKKA